MSPRKPSYPRGNLFIPGPAGRIECVEWRAEGSPLWAVVSHPHPARGGTLHNKVVYRAARAFQAAGFGVLRYNFRGAGNSEGTFDEGRGEADDLRAVLDHVEKTHAPRHLILAGFSFGSWINSRVGCGDPRVEGILHMGLPADTLDLGFLWSCSKPTVVIQGDLDEFGSWPKILEVVESMPDARLIRIEGAGHFFEGKMAELERALAEAIEHLKPEDPGR